MRDVNGTWWGGMRALVCKGEEGSGTGPWARFRISLPGELTFELPSERGAGLDLAPQGTARPRRGRASAVPEGDSEHVCRAEGARTDTSQRREGAKVGWGPVSQQVSGVPGKVRAAGAGQQG